MNSKFFLHAVILLTTSALFAGYPSVERFEKAIAAFEEKDREAPSPEGAIVAIGSSSMRGWHTTIAEDLEPLTIIPRGFGGSNMNDVLAFADRVIIPYKPRAILLYEGDNDVAQKVPPEKILATYTALADKIHAALPECRIYVLAVKPSPRRWDMWPTMVETNTLLAAACAADERMTYIDIASPMLNEAGKPKPDIFKKDQLHMNRAGYVLWRDAVRPVLVAAERKYEAGEGE